MGSTAAEADGHRQARPLRIAAALARRWPTALAIGLWALSLGGGDSDDVVGSFSEVLLLLPLLYLVVAGLQRRRASWVVLAVGMTAFVALRALEVVAPSAVFVTVALLVLVWGGVRGQLHRSGMFSRIRCARAGRVGRGSGPGPLPGGGWLVPPWHLGLCPPQRRQGRGALLCRVVRRPRRADCGRAGLQVVATISWCGLQAQATTARLQAAASNALAECGV